MREIKRRYLEESKCEIIEFLLLAESDEELLAELRVEEDLLLLEGELLLARLAQHGVAQGGDVVADVVNTSLLWCIEYFSKREYFYIKSKVSISMISNLPGEVLDHPATDSPCHTW